MKIIHVVGARPNFMKAAPVISAIQSRNSASQLLVHTGQHYDEKMSKIFFEELGMPRPDRNLEVGSGSHARQTAEIMQRFETVVLKEKPALVLVYGDVNSTVAAAMVSAKLQVPVGHVEAGLRSFDRTMPEEINRLLTDQISDLLFTPSEDGDTNLLREGILQSKIFRVGNAMIDTLHRLLPQTERRPVLDQLGFKPREYGLVTLHRPSNVDEPDKLAQIVASLESISERIPLIFPIHPRTRNRWSESGMEPDLQSLRLLDPIGYLDFLCLQRNSRFVITDSGGIQEETTVLGIPCLTLRENTERPITLEMGTNKLVRVEHLESEADQILAGNSKTGSIPPLWDGKAGDRIAELIEHYGQQSTRVPD